MKIEVADINSPFLPAIKRLGRSNAATLGFLPEGAFDENAKKKRILIALDKNDNFIGYLLYRIAKRKASIVHLCVDERLRKTSAAKNLVEQLKKETTDLLGIGLRCRRDYDANKIWSKFGFVAIDESEGRGKDAKDLVYWWFNHGHPTLFDANPSEEFQERLVVVADANVFFDIVNPQRDGHIESNSLRADWLEDSIEICLVEEIYNEINRSNDKIIREKSRDCASQFRLLNTSKEKAEKLKKKLKELPSKSTKQLTLSDESDIAQLSQAICSSAPYFATRDEDLLNISDEIFNKYGLRVIRPSDLIIRLDELRRESEYQPARLSGTYIKTTLVKSGQGEALNSLFQNFGQCELKRDFQQNIRRFLANPADYYCFQVINEKGHPMALIVYDKSVQNSLKVLLFRVKKSNLSRTLTRHLILKIINDSHSEKRLTTRIEDKFLTEEIKTAADEEGFLESRNQLVKFHLNDVLTSIELSEKVRELPFQNSIEENFLTNISDVLNKQNYPLDAQIFADIEKALYPVKIIDAYLPCFIIPIQPQWAMELFDENLAKQSLYGAKEDLALRKEQIYYRSPKNSNGLKAPARILWYVSEGKSSKGYLGTKAITACSFLDEVLVDKPKVLFQMFKRLGIYSWKEIFSLAKEDINNSIMTLRFSHTQQFNNPIDLPELKTVLERNGSKLQLISPFPIPPNAFIDLYKQGIILKKDAIK